MSSQGRDHILESVVKNLKGTVNSLKNAPSRQNKFSHPNKTKFGYFAGLSWPEWFLVHASENHKQILNCFPGLISGNYWKFYYYNQSLWRRKSHCFLTIDTALQHNPQPHSMVWFECSLFAVFIVCAQYTFTNYYLNDSLV